MKPENSKKGGPPPVEFTIDGEAFSTEDRSQLAKVLLADFAQLDPANYDLGELHGNNPEPNVFADDDTVHIHPGARYVSLRVGPGPVE